MLVKPSRLHMPVTSAGGTGHRHTPHREALRCAAAHTGKGEKRRYSSRKRAARRGGCWHLKNRVQRVFHTSAAAPVNSSLAQHIVLGILGASFLSR